MGQQSPVVLAAKVIFWACLSVGLGAAAAAASANSDLKYKGERRHGDALQESFGKSNILQFGSGKGRGIGIEDKPDFTNIKRVLRDEREKKDQANRDPVKVFPSKQSVTEDAPSSAAGILGTLSEEGLEYVKDVLIGEILEEVTPLKITDVFSRINSPIGRVEASFTNIYLTRVEVFYSEIQLDPNGITIYAGGIKASLEARWEYDYTATYVPFPVGDGGRAKVLLSGMEAGVSFTLAERNGTLRLDVEEAGTYIEDLEIVLEGGASWFYQWFVYAFDYEIRAAVEVALTQQMVKGVEKLDDWVLNLPRAIPIDETSAIDVTVLHDPLLSPTFLSIGAKGQFVCVDKPIEYPVPDVELPPGLFCDQSLKMVTIAVSDYVLNSASFVYYSSGELMWDVDTLPGQKYLNTASWRYLIPKLYKKYPNEDMAINFAVSAAPAVDITGNGIKVTAGADMTIEVKDGEDLVPVACINLMVSFDAVASLSYSNITATATMDELTLALKWSEIGSFPVYLVQATVRALVQEIVLPIINLNLQNGFPIPMVAGVAIENADLRYGDGYILICTDISYKGGYFNSWTHQKSTFELHDKQ